MKKNFWAIALVVGLVMVSGQVWADAGTIGGTLTESMTVSSTFYNNISLDTGSTATFAEATINSNSAGGWILTASLLHPTGLWMNGMDTAADDSTELIPFTSFEYSAVSGTAGGTPVDGADGTLTLTSPTAGTVDYVTDLVLGWDTPTTQFAGSYSNTLTLTLTSPP